MITMEAKNIYKVFASLETFLLHLLQEETFLIEAILLGNNYLEAVISKHDIACFLRSYLVSLGILTKLWTGRVRGAFTVFISNLYSKALT